MGHSRGQVAKVIAGMIEDGSSRVDLARKVAAFLITEGQVKELDSLMRDVTRIRAESGTLEVATTSAFPLSNNVKQQIEQIVASIQGPALKKVIMDEVIEPGVLAGVRIETPDRQLDLTIRSRLDRLKRYTATNERTNRGLIS